MVFTRQQLVLGSFLLVSLATTVIFFHDNTDHRTHSLRTELSDVQMFSLKNPELYQALKRDSEEKVSKIEEIMLVKRAAAKGKCLKDPSATKSTKAQLESFVEGDCSPIVLLPGLMATKLMVEIDCETLMKHHPEVMDACGWSTCTWSWWARKPASEYLLWIPSFISSLSMISIGNSSTCFGRFVSTVYNASAASIDQKYSYPKGVRITWYGNTPGTSADHDGGLASIRDLLPLPFQASLTQEFGVMTHYLSDLGYQTGLTLFGIPYNFLLTYLANEVSYTLERTIRYAYELTGKKVVVIGHSLGNLNTLPALNRMSQEDKDKMVASYVAIAPPFGGAPKSLQNAYGGDPSFQFSFGIGVNFFSQSRIVGGASSTQDLIPKDLFYRFRNESWLQDLTKRIQLEKKYNPKTSEGRQFWMSKNLSDIPFPFFPSPNETCFNGFSSRNDQCELGVSDLSTEPIIKIENKTYYANITSMQEMAREHLTIRPLDDFNNMWNDSLQAGVEAFTNPGVPIVYIYASHIGTELRYEWEDGPEKNTKNGNFAFPTNAVMNNGDGTVEVSYSLPVAFKWAWENINLGENKNAKAIKLVEFCSSYNKSRPIWDGFDVNGTRIMNTTSYSGLSCHCSDSLPTDGKDCFHAQMPNDPYIMELVRDLAATNQTVANKSSTAAFRLSDSALTKLKIDVPSLKRPRDDQNVTSWLQGAYENNENNYLLISN